MWLGIVFIFALHYHIAQLRLESSPIPSATTIFGLNNTTHKTYLLLLKLAAVQLAINILKNKPIWAT